MLARVGTEESFPDMGDAGLIIFGERPSYPSVCQLH